MEVAGREAESLRRSGAAREVEGPHPAAVAGEQAAVIDTTLGQGSVSVARRVVMVAHGGRNYRITLTTGAADLQAAAHGLDQILAGWRWLP